jgi:hypothetical protein
VLAEAGLRGGLTALAEESHHPIDILAVPAGRLPTATETTAYLLVSTLARCGALTVSIVDHDETVTIDVEADALPGSLTDVDDRIGALGGTLTVRRPASRFAVHADLPCG